MKGKSEGARRKKVRFHACANLKREKFCKIHKDPFKPYLNWKAPPSLSSPKLSKLLLQNPGLSHSLHAAVAIPRTCSPSLPTALSTPPSKDLHTCLSMSVLNSSTDIKTCLVTIK